jgi:hypothetical protein
MGNIMKNFLLGLLVAVAYYGLSAATVHAQCSGVFAADQVCANASGSPSTPKPTTSLRNLSVTTLFTPQAITMQGGALTGLITPSNPSDAATKSYVDSNVTGITVLNPAKYATTAQLAAYTWSSTGGGTLTATGNGAISVDGNTPSVADRILVKNEPNSGTACNTHVDIACNGIYTVSQVGTGGTPYILLRSTDTNVAADWPSGAFVLVTNGTANAGTQWTNTTKVTTLNTDPITFQQFGQGATSVWLLNGLKIYYNSGNVGIGTTNPPSLLTVMGLIESSSLQLDGGSSGSTTLVPASVASGTITVPSVTDTLAVIGTAQTWTAVQTYTNSDIKLLGSSTGATTFTSANAGASNFTLTFPAVTDTLATLGTASQALTGGVHLTAHAYATGNITVDCGFNPVQYVANNAAFTITAPSADSSCLILVRNTASAGAITFSGFSVGSSTGDALTTVNGNIFTISVWRITDATGSVSGYRVAAMQ